MLSNFRTETKMDIDELKKEIYAIVLQECVVSIYIIMYIYIPFLISIILIDY